mmetsp:Transcript_93102/g.247285  ORF Transcript_93102/g.247285 Transcript_93102/m.247285 type:complete len:232 (+) Transcript_93102:859-1554(+)
MVHCKEEADVAVEERHALHLLVHLGTECVCLGGHVVLLRLEDGLVDGHQGIREHERDEVQRDAHPAARDNGPLQEVPRRAALLPLVEVWLGELVDLHCGHREQADHQHDVRHERQTPRRAGPEAQEDRVDIHDREDAPGAAEEKVYLELREARPAQIGIQHHRHNLDGDGLLVDPAPSLQVRDLLSCRARQHIGVEIRGEHLSFLGGSRRVVAHLAAYGPQTPVGRVDRER